MLEHGARGSQSDRERERQRRVGVGAGAGAVGTRIMSLRARRVHTRRITGIVRGMLDACIHGFVARTEFSD